MAYLSCCFILILSESLPMLFLKKYWDEKPLNLILGLAIIFRLISVIFSKGYGMHDDHFLVIETAQSWLDGADYNNWFKEREFTDTPTILNFLYAGIHYLLFGFLQWIGIFNPEVKMFFSRILHSAFSLIVVTGGYELTRRLSGVNAARISGLLLAIYFFMPFLAVRNLVEIVCIPFLILAFLFLTGEEIKRKPAFYAFLAGIMFGMAFCFRFQTLIMAGGAGLVILFRRQWLQAIVMGAGIIIPVLIFHGLTDLLIWGYPFAELKVYFLHNMENRYSYTVAPWHLYTLMIIGLLLPPVSLYILTGLFYRWKKNIILFLPVVLFIIFHSIFPNKQERFIFPVIPLLIIAGIAGWQELAATKPWQRFQTAIRAGWVFFWIINIVLLIFFSSWYTKKARVDSMKYLAEQGTTDLILIDDMNHDDAIMLPYFYLSSWPSRIEVAKKHPPTEIDSTVINTRKPDYFLFVGNTDLEKRTADIGDKYSGLRHLKTVNPGFMDRTLNSLNPINRNVPIHIYTSKPVE